MDKETVDKFLVDSQKRLFEHCLIKSRRDVIEAEELLHTTNVRFLEAIGKGLVEKLHISYLISISNNLFLDKLRMINNRKTTIKPTEKFDAVEDVISEQPIQINFAKLIEYCKLPPHWKAVVERRLEGKDFKEIAIELDMPLNTCLGSMNYVKKRFREKIEEKGIDIFLVGPEKINGLAV